MLKIKNTILPLLALQLILVGLCSVARAEDPVSSGLEAGVYQLAQDLAGQMEKAGIKKIAVVEFTDLNGFQSALGDFIAEELITGLFKARPSGLDVIERRELARVLNEQKLGSTGLFDPKTMSRIGGLLGIEAVVTGTITYLGNSIKINARLIGVDTAKTFGAGAVKVAKDSTIEELVGQSGRPEPAGHSVGSSSAVSQVQRHDISYKDETFLITPEYVKKIDNGKSVMLALKIQNLTKQPQYLALKHTTTRIHASLTGDDGLVLGEVWSDVRVTGLSTVWLNGGQKKTENYTEIPALGQVIVTIAFTGKDQSKATKYLFSSDMVHYRSNDGILKAVGFSGIVAY